MTKKLKCLLLEWFGVDVMRWYIDLDRKLWKGYIDFRQEVYSWQKFIFWWDTVCRALTNSTQHYFESWRKGHTPSQDYDIP